MSLILWLWVCGIFLNIIQMNRLKILVAVLAMAVATAAAQNVTTPYSMYGYGILSDRATSMQRQMGGVGYAMNSGRQINVMNPASYAAIDSMTFLFDMGADLTMLWSKEGNIKENSFGGGLDYVTMQFPICKYMGGSVGLLPYSSVGYAFGNEIHHGTMENQGSGGINEAYLGVSGKIGGFSLGVNVSYDFGTIVNDVFSNPTSGGQSKFEHVMQLRDWNLVAGLQYTQRLSKTDKAVVGITYSPKKSLHGKTWATVQELKQETVADTVGFMKMNGKYYTPTSVGAGISFTHERVSRWTAEVDFTWQQWSDAKFSPMYETSNPDNIIFKGMSFDDRWKIAAGYEIVPRVRGSYVQRMSYRIGAYYTHDYLRINGNGLREFGASAGIGLPTPEGKTMVNFGLEWKHRQASPEALISEDYFNITIGVNINEVWFWKRKIN